MCGAPPGSQRRMTAVSSSVAGSDAAGRIRSKSGMARAPTPNAPAPRKWRRVIGPGQRTEENIWRDSGGGRGAGREAYRREGRTELLFYPAGGAANRIGPRLPQGLANHEQDEPDDHEDGRHLVLGPVE